MLRRARSLRLRRQTFGGMFRHPVSDAVDELAAALAVDRSDAKHRALPAVRLHERRDTRLTFFRCDQIDLVEHEPPRLGGERCVVALELPDDRARIGEGIGRVEQQTRALQMPQETMAEAGALRSALDQSWNVGDDKTPVMVQANDTQMRSQRRERIFGDLGPCCGNGSNERRFSRVRHAEQTDVGEHLQFETKAPLLALLPGRRLPRRAVDARFEMQIAQASAAAASYQRGLAVGSEIGDQLATDGIGNHRAHRDAQHDVLSAAAILIGAAALLAVAGAVNAGVAIIDERVEVAIRANYNAPSAAAVASVRATSRDVLLAPEG